MAHASYSTLSLLYISFFFEIQELVDTCFFDDSPFFRVVDGFMAQFGIGADKRTNKQWETKGDIQDDEVLSFAKNEMGTLSFAKPPLPDSRSTQIFINLEDNYFLDVQGFTPFATVVDGWTKVKNTIYSGYGEDGPDQNTMKQKGSKIAFKSHPKLTKIRRVEFISG